MHFLQPKFLVLICIYLLAFVRVSFQAKDERSVKKKDLKVPATADEAEAHTFGPPKVSQPANYTAEANYPERNSITQVKTQIFQKSLDDIEIPESFKMGFYFFIGLSIAAILFILVKIYRMRLSRAERKYGVHGDRTTQELTPLPMAIEDDSDNEDHTLFDINRQVRVS